MTGTHFFTSNVWHHAALTYDGTHLTLYLDGVLDQSVAASGIPDYTTRQPAALGSALNSAATAAGAFAGIMDEVRIWNYARTAAQIQAAMWTETTSGAGLLGRWGLNDGTGTTATNSVPGSPDGTLLGATMPAWTNDTPFARPGSDRNGDESRGQRSPGHWFERHPGGRREPDRDGQHRRVLRQQRQRGPEHHQPLHRGLDCLCCRARGVGCRRHRHRRRFHYLGRGQRGLLSSPAPARCNSTASAPTSPSARLTSTLGLSTFTLECWLKRTGKGTIANTGSGGTSGAPLIAKGMGEADANNRDCNYFFGVDSSGRLVADFEEGSTGAAPGLNHPVAGRTALVNGVWTHAAVTYDGYQWALYVNGVPDGDLDVNAPPRSDSIQHAALGAALNSSGSPGGFFEGLLDEARIWNYARTAGQIAGSMNTAITNATGLVGRWSLNDGSGATALNSVPASPNGTLVNGPIWCQGLDLAPATNTPPSVRAHQPRQRRHHPGHRHQPHHPPCLRRRRRHRHQRDLLPGRAWSWAPSPAALTTSSGPTTRRELTTSASSRWMIPAWRPPPRSPRLPS